MSKKTYLELLKDPRWQRKRLQVMDKAGFACRICGDEETTLNVHHGYYEKNKKPWEYPDESLHCLCETCHLEAKNKTDQIKKMLGSIGGSAVSLTLGYLLGIRVTEGPFGELVLDDYEVIQGFCDWMNSIHGFDVYAEQIIDILVDGKLIEDVWLKFMRNKKKHQQTISKEVK